MDLKPIRTEAEHRAALAEIERLWEVPEQSPEADRLEVLALLVEAYEKTHYPIAAPDPVSFIEHVMDARGLTRKDLEPFIGPRGRVADILNRTRPLSMGMIRNLTTGLNLPADILIQPYPLREDAHA
ncbi:MAG: transcriptional regulator [Pseudomonadota bacterium]|nr:transcriptional regulator [Pseudomonadota bacterium]OYY93202.1 MAG: transcriptional regulator [Hydrogenophilales bacterium 28-61-23]